MWTAEVALACALELLGRSPSTLPPITVVEAAPSFVSPRAEAFVLEGDPHIYVIGTSPLVERLRRSPAPCGDFDSTRKLASVLVHEETHLTHGPNEDTAYRAQLTTLAALGAGAGTPLYDTVSRARREVLTRPRVVLTATENRGKR